MFSLDNRLAIDPMALILHGKALDTWYLIHNPNEPPGGLKEILRAMPPEEQKAALARARMLIRYGKAVEEALATAKA